MIQAKSERVPGEDDKLALVAELGRGGKARLAELIALLAEPGWAVRRAIVAALAEAPAEAMPVLCDSLSASRENEAVIAGLVDALSVTRHDVDDLVLSLMGGANSALLCDAAHILGRRESRRAVARLELLSVHEDDNVALAAIEALGRIGTPEALDCLLTRAQGRSFFRTFPTIDILGRSGDARAIPALLQLASDPLYASEAVRALGRLRDASAAPALVNQLSRASGSLACAIAVALATIHDAAEQRFGSGIAIERLLLASPKITDIRRQLALALKRADATEQLALSQALSWVGEESTVPILLGLLKGSPEVAQVAARSLKKLGPVAEPALIEAVRRASSEERRLLVPILAGKLAAQRELVACLDDEDPTVRALSCDALARSSDSSAVPALFELLGDPDPRVAQSALAAIQALGSDRTQDLAFAAARSDNSRIRRAGLRIIGYFGYSEGLDILEEASTADDEKIREAAIAALPLIEDPRALRLLLSAAQHETTRVRTAAVRALGHTTGDPSALGRLREALRDGDPWVRYYACQALGRLRDDSATDFIASLLQDEFGQVRVAAVEALAHLRGPRAFEVLRGVLGSEDADLNRAGLVALGLSKRAEAQPLLLAALGSESAATRLVALSALAELGLPEVLPAIARASLDSDEGVRVAATGFLAATTSPAATSELLTLLARNPSSEPLLVALARPIVDRCAALSAALSGADEPFAAALVAALSRMQTEEARAALRNALASNNDFARRAAASALVATQDSESAAVLERAALSDPDAEVRRICAAALAR